MKNCIMCRNSIIKISENGPKQDCPYNEPCQPCVYWKRKRGSLTNLKWRDLKFNEKDILKIKLNNLDDFIIIKVLSWLSLSLYVRILYSSNSAHINKRVYIQYNIIENIEKA